MDGERGTSRIDVRALDADDMSLAGDFDIRTHPAHHLRASCPSPHPYPSWSVAVKVFPPQKNKVKF